MMEPNHSSNMTQECFVKMLLNGVEEINKNVQSSSLKSYLTKNPREINPHVLAVEVSQILLNPENCLLVARTFPQLLLLLLKLASKEQHDVFQNGVERVVHIGVQEKQVRHLRLCVTLGKLVTVHPDAVRFSVDYFSEHLPPFEYLRNTSTSSGEAVSNLDIVIACHCFLHCNEGDYFRKNWDWSQLANLLQKTANEKIKWVIIQCIATASGMADWERQKLLQNHLAKDKISSCVLWFNNFLDDLKIQFSTLHLNNVILPTTIIMGGVVTVCGVQLPILKTCKKKSGYLHPVASTQKNLRRLAMGIVYGKAICLQGPVGCGKTALIEHLGELTGRVGPPDLIKVQLGDQTDSKLLLGSYKCTDVPGEFVWQSGLLTQAVENGYWIMLEDIDSASSDLISVLASLLETKMLCVPGYCDTVPIARGFQLFLTRRILNRARTNLTSKLLESHWLHIDIDPLRKVELLEVVKEMFPQLEHVAERLVDTFFIFSQETNEQMTEDNSSLFCNTKLRLISTRDLLKWCRRSNKTVIPGSKESTLKVYQDAIDIFCCSENILDKREEYAKAISNKLGITHTQATYFCKLHNPSVAETENQLTIGRAVLLKNDSTAMSVTRRKVLAMAPSVARLLERVARSVEFSEPVLLVGETGTGKTHLVQHLADRTRNRLFVLNMNQQSESADLLGGYKPLDLRFVIKPVFEEYEKLFTSFYSATENMQFLIKIGKCFNERKWTLMLNVMKHTCTTALNSLEKVKVMTPDRVEYFLSEWNKMCEKINKLERQINTKSKLAFSFIEGSLVEAVRKGYWVLLDEINLASAETLECLSGLLEDASASLQLLEKGDGELVEKHPNFRLFACMNPATDVGKRDLPAGLRNRFTEFFVDEILVNSELQMLVASYLQNLALPTDKIADLVNFYRNVKKLACTDLSDGMGNKPHYSLRTLCRALIAAQNPFASISRTLYEAFCMSFLTQLDYSSHPKVENMIMKAVFGAKEKGNALQNSVLLNQDQKKYTCFEGFWIKKGPLEIVVPDKYILTKSVRRNLHDLVRVVSLAQLPVLLQGETSVGKTSLITYLAKATGHHCIRINNHEHTDLQEYIGSYVADENGLLVFREGALIEAMRKGHWIILDELNLAPTDVLEALNRVLDDNRELFIPETQELVKSHPQFMLFATQNPPGLYGGRKMLSRAFRNRFVELHFDKIPPKELETILQERCELPASYCKRLVAVMEDLQLRRRGSQAFAGRHGFMTLRDLFRWGERYRLAKHQTGFYDWDLHMAEEGYLLLAGRVRCKEEEEIICDVLKQHFNKLVQPKQLFTMSETTSRVTLDILQKICKLSQVNKNSDIVWTYNMRRMAVLICKAFNFGEPVLLVGETGCGKTTVCQVLAELHDRRLFILNCHMHSESSDFLGGLRPMRNKEEDSQSPEGVQKLFEWVDGPLVTAMQEGSWFLCDEISLADDSVLERMNSLLEPDRKLLLAEKGSGENSSNGIDTSCIVVAAPDFRFLGTMNPGGDYGKKELSPALRNRFTEIWCDSNFDPDDLKEILQLNQKSGFDIDISTLILDFLEWFRCSKIGNKFQINIRDLITWTSFYNTCTVNKNVKSSLAYIHGACLTFLDSFGTGVTSNENIEELNLLRRAALLYLSEQVRIPLQEVEIKPEVQISSKLIISPFFLEMGPENSFQNSFTFSAPTTANNALRVLRGLQLRKPLLLEGSPGVGKTSLVSAIAQAAGYSLVRINISEQTDVSDLFGAYLPVEGGKGGEFAWRDGPFLRALKNSHWILLDELNLASQSVLEGLNACFDHRGEVYIPELDRTFYLQSQTRLFATQNPQRQGGARKGLPRSFLNRFTQVYIDKLDSEDLRIVLSTTFPTLPVELVKDMISFNNHMVNETGPLGHWGSCGGPWELNLRDLSRWAAAIVEGKAIQDPSRYLQLIYADRMRTKYDRDMVKQLAFQNSFECKNDDIDVTITPRILYVSEVAMERHTTNSKIGILMSQGSLTNIHNTLSAAPIHINDQPIVLRSLQHCLRSLLQCLHMGWMPILVGPSGIGKTKLVHLAAQLAGRELQVLSVNSAMDTSEILGGFEQVNYWHHLMDIINETQRLIHVSFRYALMHNHSLEFMETWLKFRKHLCAKRRTRDMTEFVYQVSELERILSSVASQCDPLTKSLLDFITGKLEKLKSEVNCDKKLNTGGKFEWIDSILIKALNRGCWLLLDNVNLCSPAVLDRLNALLEPGGKLTIEERGILPNGNLVSITPHPSFRLIMTMDPINGEISRAMRNRGVEIFFHRDEMFTEIDEMCVAFNSGVTDYSLQEALLDVHHTISNNITGENTLSSLHETGQLVYENLIRGHQTYELFLANCFDVYARQGTLSHSRIKDCIEATLENHRKTITGNTDNSFKPYAMEEIMFVVSKFVSNTSFSSLRLNSAPVTIAISCMGKSISSLRKIFKLYSEWTQKELLPGLVFVLYATSCLGTLELCHKWISSVSNKSNVYTTLTSSGNLILNSVILSKTLLTVIQKNMKTEYVEKSLSHFKNELVDSDFLPWDIQWVSLMQLMQDKSQHLKVYTSAVNSLHILNYLEYRKFIEFSQNSSENHEKKHFTLLSLSEEFIAGNLSELQVPQSILLQQIAPLLKLVNDFLKTVLLGGQIDVGTQNLTIFLNAIHWYIQFAKQANFSLLEVKSNMSQLYQHFFWLYYYTVKPVFEVCMHNNISGSNSACLLNSLVKNIKEELSQSISPLVVFSADIRKLMGHIVMPNIHLCSALERFSNIITFSAKTSTENSTLVEKRKKFTVSEEGINAVNNLINVYHLMWDESADCRVSELMNQVSGPFEAVLQIESDQLNITSNDPLKLQDLSCLWPLFEVLELRLGFALLSNFTGSNNTISSNTASKLIASLPGVPPILKALNLYLEQNIKTLKEARLYELIECFLKHIIDSRATNVYIRSIQKDSESSCNEYLNMVYIPLHCPLLTLHSIILISPLQKNSPENRCESSEVSLNSYNFHCQKLQSVRSFIWKNASVLFDDLLNPVLNDAKSCLAVVHKFVNILSQQYFNLVRSEGCNLQKLKECVMGTMSQNMDLVSLNILESNLNNLVIAESDLVNALHVNSNNAEEEMLTIVKNTGELWIAFGHFQFFMYSFLGLMDPVEKRKIKISYMEQEERELKCLSAAFETFARLHGRSWERLPEPSKHPFLTALTTCLNSIESVKFDNTKNCTFRPQGAPKFDVLKKELLNFTSNLTEKSKEMWTHISKYSNDLLITGLNKQLDSIQKEKLVLSSHDLLLKANNIQQSQNIFVDRLTMEYKSYYPDLTAPLSTALTQISYGMNIICGVISKVSTRIANACSNTQLDQSLEFPFIRPSVVELLKTAENFQSYQDLLSDVRHTANVISILDKSSDYNVWERLHNLLNSAVALWQEIEDKNKLQQKEKDSLFVHKSSKVDIGDDEGQDLEMNFPSWVQKDFFDMEQTTLENTTVQNVIIDNCLQQEQLHSICELYCDIVQSYSYANWLSPKHKLQTNFVEPLKQKYTRNITELFEACKGANNTLDEKLMAGLVVLSSFYLGPGKPCGREPIDFYHDEQIHEAKRCMPILVDLRTNVMNLLQQWPDHPTLNQIIIVMERILKFPISSPIPRFLTGLELLLGKLNDWEQNAHQGVSLMGCTNFIKELVVDWRRLELASWKMSLDSAYKRYQRKALRWWFHLYSVIEAFLSEENESSPSELQETLKLFVNSSTLGDFDIRLDLLYKFHCHVLHFKPSQNQEMLLRLLWNLHSQFTQLQPSIANQLKNMRLPIEKKLKDFIKVARWHDMSYWAITESIAKSHRAVHKFIKEFEKILSQHAISPGLTVPVSEIYLSVKCKDVNLLGFLADVRPEFQGKELEIDVSNENTLSNLRNFFLKSRKLCKGIIESCDYTQLFSSLSCIMNELLERANSDKNTQIDYTQSKDKQKAHAKHLLNIRRKTLTDVFHALQMLGLSYRVGLQLNAEPDTSLLELPVIELSTLLSASPIHPLADVQLLLAWSNSDQEFSRANIMMTEFDKVIKSPSSDLGLGNIERLKGFASHLMGLAREQKNAVYISTSHLHKLREKIAQLSMLNENEFLQMKPSVVMSWKNRVVEVLVITQMCLEQFSVIMDSCPSSEDQELNVPSIQLSENRPLPSISLASKGDSTWSNAKSLIQSANEIIRQQKCNIENVSSIGGITGVCWGVQCKLIINIYGKLKIVIQLVKDIINIFEEKNGLYLNNPIARSLHWLHTFLQKSVSDFHSSEFNYSETVLKYGHNVNSSLHTPQDTELKKNFDTYLSTLNTVITNILFIIQEEYKNRNLEIKLSESNREGNFSSEKEKPEDLIPGDTTDYELKTGHLKEKIMKSLQTTITNLHLPELNSHVENLLSILADAMENRNFSPEAKLYKSLLVKMSPFLHQLSLLAEFFILQQVEAFQITSHLLSHLVPIFKHFAAKGFGIPPDLLPDEDGEESGKGSGGMGLGEGEGQKDVSERIESEDQLEDAHLPGEREEKDDQDCKEEKEGIDTVEDFGGKSQEMQGDDNSDTESHNEDMDHEMGEAEGLDDKLDKKIWDGSDDEDPEDDSELPDEEGSKGEKIGCPELGAKDGKRKHDDENEMDENDCDPPKQRKEINELEDPLVDDDQIDPYHGNQKNEDEPEPMDLPDNLQLDDGEGKDGAEEGDENPFDIDDMKENKNPEIPEDKVDKEAADTKTGNEEDTDTSLENNDEEKESREGEEQRGEDDSALENDKNHDTEKDSNEQAGDETSKDDKTSKEDEATPSYDKASEYNAEPSETESGSKDQVSAEMKLTEDSVNDGQSQKEENSQNDKQGFGQAEIEEDEEGHHGISEAKSNSQQQNSQLEMQQQRRQRPGISDSKRKLGEVKEPALKRLKTVDTCHNEDKLHDEDMEEIVDKTSSNVYQHITDATESFNAEVIDAATKEQAEIQPTLNIEDDSNNDTKDEDDDDNIEMLEDKEESENKSEKQQKPEKVSGEEHKQKQGKEKGENDTGNFMQVTVEGEKVDTLTVSRGMETTFHTHTIPMDTPVSKKEMDEEARKIRMELERQLSSWTQIPTTVEAEKAWEMFSSVTVELARDLSEQLRLVLEPTKASRLMGDFRTGRRINMRKVIPYIASDFRKDKIWLRRTRPSKREYQIVLAIDDSSSMNDSHSKELAFESLALLSQSLTLLEVGELAVVGFGERVELLHQLGQPFNPISGATLLQKFQFEQKGTRVGQMLQFVTHLLEKCDKGTDRAQLLVIVSDGRGVFSEGKDEVLRATSLTKSAGILTVFVILDSPNSKDSILDIRTPNFTGGKVTIKTYMDEFPFPFYVILKDINALPSVLSDALRQWFELVANADNLLT